MINQTISKVRRADWVDAAKFIAIMGVLIDHTDGLLYTDKRIAYMSYYSVSLFILMMGITSYWSYKKTAETLPVPGKLKRNCIKILIPYLGATLIYCIFLYGRLWFSELFEHLIHFNATTPFYYVSLYLQLVLVAPALFYVFQTADQKKNRLMVELTGFIVVIVIARLTNYYTNIFNIYGGGGKLFGGHYLVLFYLGMWFGKYCSRISLKNETAVICFVLSLGLTVGCALFISNDRLHIDSLLHCAPGFNPPGISLCTYAILAALSVYFFGILSDNHRLGFLSKPFAFSAYLGRHTLYVYLYHRLFIDFIFPFMLRITGLRLRNLLLRAVLYFVIIYIGSILFEVILKKFSQVLKDFFVHAYTPDTMAKK